MTAPRASAQVWSPPFPRWRMVAAGRQAGRKKTRCAPRRRAKITLSRGWARDAPPFFCPTTRPELRPQWRAAFSVLSGRAGCLAVPASNPMGACDPQSEGTVGRGVREGRAGGRWRGVPLGARRAVESGIAWAARLGSACRGVR